MCLSGPAGRWYSWGSPCPPRCSKADKPGCVWLCSLADSPHKGQVKADRQLEVQLNCCTLVVTSNCIFDFNINLQYTKNPMRPLAHCCYDWKWKMESNLGAVESSITRVQFPWFPKLIQTVLQLLPEPRAGQRIIKINISEKRTNRAVKHKSANRSVGPRSSNAK